MASFKTVARIVPACSITVSTGKHYLNCYLPNRMVTEMHEATYMIQAIPESTMTGNSLPRSSSMFVPGRPCLVALQSNGFIASFPRTSLAKLLSVVCVQPGTSNVVVWHQGLSANSFSITAAKCSDQPFRGKADVVVSINLG